MVNIGNDWDGLLSECWQSPEYKQLRQFLVSEYRTRTVYPPAEDIFTALRLCSYADTRVVIIGQDPYHGEGQAHGLCFSVRYGIKPPPSLVNIFKEQGRDLGVTQPEGCGYLEPWARQGVLMLNAVLTVRAGEAGSHAGKGWEWVTDRIIELLNQKSEPVIFLLWGNYAIKKASVITNPIHRKLTSVHPSPLSAHRGFIGCGHFSEVNRLLADAGSKPIDWQL